MKRILLVLILSLAWATPAYAFKTTISKAGTMEATKPFQSFGNFKVGDCQYETAANLILARWPKAKITTAEVESAWTTYGDAGVNGEYASQQFLTSTGFAGHHATSITLITEAQAISAANSGGVEVTNLGPVRNHMFAIVSATQKNVEIIDDGYVYHYTWAWLNWAYTQSGESLAFYGVTW